MKRFIGIIVFNLISLLAASQVKDSIKKSTAINDPFILTVEQSLNAFYADFANQSNYDSIINALNYEPGQIPRFPDSIYCQRLEKMNDMSPFQLDCAPPALATIKFFAEKRRSFARVVLGRSALYFEMFEEKLAHYGLPIELKYLAVIESGLRPQVKSRAGALGLWQFMYRTGLYYGLNENSYIDERMDPEKATDAACQYLKKLHDIYGDWNLALASYNAGPGNVNKAIRRSGGKKTYWEVRPFLPLETQGYVPNFIAAAYLLTYHAEHNIVPMEAKWNYGQLDTMCLKNGVHMSTINKLTGWDLDEIQTLNPIYKTGYIPYTKQNQCITGPLKEIGKLVSLEDELYALEKKTYLPEPIKPMELDSSTIIKDDSLSIETPIKVSGDKSKPVKTKTTKVVAPKVVPVKEKPVAPIIVYVYHSVRRGEGLGIIAAKYNITVNEILTTNNMKSTVLFTGQRLKIPQIVVNEALKIEGAVKEIEDADSVKVTKTVVPVKKPKPVVPAKKYCDVKEGDTGIKIAQKYNLTQQQLMDLNPGINLEIITVGQQLRVK
jgi:membrane-bound lytic murein transglycosylase D